MKKWQREELDRCVDRFNATGDYQNLLDIPRIMVYSRQKAILIEWVEWAKEKVRTAIRTKK